MIGGVDSCGGFEGALSFCLLILSFHFALPPAKLSSTSPSHYSIQEKSPRKAEPDSASTSKLRPAQKTRLSQVSTGSHYLLIPQLLVLKSGFRHSGSFPTHSPSDQKHNPITHASASFGVQANIAYSIIIINLLIL